MILEKTQTKLTKEQIHAVSLLSIGTFLEYFDRILYAHTAIILNDLFFPETSPHIRSLIPAFSFCSGYLLTPFGALFAGRLGDVFGRKSVIVLTNFLMAACSVTIAFLPTYQQIGIMAPIVLTLCRMLQNMSGISEIHGVEIYLTETIRPPIQYPVIALIPVFSKIGNLIALSIAIIFTSAKILPETFVQDGWRLGFMLGALIGIVGAVARRSLKEASEFTDRQKLLKEQFKRADLKWSKDNLSINPKIPLSRSLAYFFVCCGRPMCFYFIFFHCAEILKNSFGFTPSQIIMHNIWPLALNIATGLTVSYLSYRISPLKIIKFKLASFFLFLTFFPWALDRWHNPTTIFVFTCIFVMLRFDHIPAAPIFMKHFPVLKRFRYTSFILSLAASLTYLLTAFGLVFLTKELGYFGILLVFIPFGVCFAWGVRYFEKMEETEKKQAIERKKSTFAGYF
jgi:MFS family permease